ncbi:hypothetical protein XarbCFBP7604_09805 [Xanthomonas arboricola]|nr:hypothetical protein XarbCFBP7604_09805 [Xanthomonas arboricola]
MHKYEFEAARHHLLSRAQGEWLLQVHELGEAAVPLQTALVAAADLCALLSDWDTYARGGCAWIDWETGKKYKDPRPGDIADAVRTAGQHAERASAAVRKLIETE